MSSTTNETTEALGIIDPRVVRSRNAVLDAAGALLKEGGLAALTVDAVVTRSGVARTTVYRHWDSRDELVVDAYRHVSPELQLPPADIPFEDRLRFVVRQVLAGLVSAGEAVPGILSAARHSARIAPMRERMNENQTDVLATILRDAVAAGHLPADTNIEEAQLQLLGPLVMATLWSSQDPSQALADRIIDLFLTSRQPTTNTNHTSRARKATKSAKRTSSTKRS